MIEGTSIICFAHDWGGDPTSKTHIMRILARRNRILWVNSVGMRRPTASARDLRRLGAKLRRALRGCVEVEPNLLVTNPLVLPLTGLEWADRLNAAILAGSLRRLARRHGLRAPILWTFLPNVNRLLGHLGERLTIYHCVDKYSEFAGVPQDALIRMERELASRAHLVLASAEQLAAELRAHNPNTHFIPHGVDLAHFARALDPATPVADELRALPRPIVGFIGLLAEWVDLRLVRELALRRPAWSFVLVGKAVRDMSPVRGLPNVRLLGQRPYAALPAYCRGFDAGIIPFAATELTLRANPLKLREYLAAGLPVVSTPMPEVKRWGSLVHLADGAAAFLEGIERALDEGAEEERRRRAEAMRGEGWEARVEEISALIEPCLGAER